MDDSEDDYKKLAKKFLDMSVKSQQEIESLQEHAIRRCPGCTQLLDGRKASPRHVGTTSSSAGTQPTSCATNNVLPSENIVEKEGDSSEEQSPPPASFEGDISETSPNGGALLPRSCSHDHLMTNDDHFFSSDVATATAPSLVRGRIRVQSDSGTYPLPSDSHDALDESGKSPPPTSSSRHHHLGREIVEQETHRPGTFRSKSDTAMQVARTTPTAKFKHALEIVHDEEKLEGETDNHDDGDEDGVAEDDDDASVGGEGYPDDVFPESATRRGYN